MKKITLPLIFLSLFLVVSISSTNKVHAEAGCILDWGQPGDPECGITAIISAPGSAAYNSMITPSFSVIGTFQVYNDIHLFHGWVTGGLNYDIIYDTSSRSWSGPVGLLPATVTLNLEVEDHQTAYDYKSVVVTVTPPPPNVNIQFSLLDEAKKFLQAILVAAKKPDTYAIVGTVSAESR